MKTKTFDWWISSAVIGHFGISVLHGRAHEGGHVALTPAQTFLVFGVILAAPLVGLAVSFVQRRVGATIVAVAMAASLLFGLINHFIVVSPDHVSQVPAPWGSSFTVTAILLVLSEAAGVVAGLRAVVGREVWS